jgi:hypothetical protein
MCDTRQGLHGWGRGRILDWSAGWSESQKPYG